MVGVSRVKIAESAEELKELMHQQPHAWSRSMGGQRKHIGDQANQNHKFLSLQRSQEPQQSGTINLIAVFSRPIIFRLESHEAR
jgi:hypothetical protein